MATTLILPQNYGFPDQLTLPRILANNQHKTVLVPLMGTGMALMEKLKRIYDVQQGQSSKRKNSSTRNQSKRQTLHSIVSFCLSFVERQADKTDTAMAKLTEWANMCAILVNKLSINRCRAVEVTYV